MNALQEFLLKRDVTNLTDTVNLGGDLKDFPFTIQAMTQDQYSDYQNRCIENPGSKKRKFNIKKFNDLIVVNHCTEPNFKDAELLKASGLMDSILLMYKTLLPGEIATLADEIMQLSGFNTGMEEEIEEVKNS